MPSPLLIVVDTDNNTEPTTKIPANQRLRTPGALAPVVDLPKPLELKPLLSDLIGRNVNVADSRVAPDPSTINDLLAVSVDRDDVPLMLAGGDKPFAYYCGAAFALAPKGRAEDAIGAAELDGDLIENDQEIMNVATRAVNDQGKAHARLTPGRTADLATLPAPVDSTRLTFQIEGCGHGNLFFWRF